MKDFSGQHAAHIQALYNHVWGAAPNPAAEYDRYVRERDERADREEERMQSALFNVREKFKNADPRKCDELAFEGDPFDAVARCFSAILNDQSDDVIKIMTGELDAALRSKAGFLKDEEGGA